MVRRKRGLAAAYALALALGVSACMGADGAGADADGAAPAPSPMHWQAILVAADGSLPVFDNAMLRLARDIGPHADIRRFSARDAGQGEIASAHTQTVLDAIAAMRPRPGEGCLVYMTSHGARDAGLYFSADDDVLRPGPLARALDAGCGAAPTVVVLSGCYSGIYAQPPVASANRIVLTAARRDRPSFGCGAGNVFTVFDDCLLGAVERGGTWRAAFDAARVCVSAEERREDERPSEPQSSFGTAAADLPVP